MPVRGSFSAHLMCSTYVAADSDLKHFLCWIQVALILYSHAIHTYAFHLHMCTQHIHMPPWAPATADEETTANPQWWLVYSRLFTECMSSFYHAEHGSGQCNCDILLFSCSAVSDFFVTPRSIASRFLYPWDFLGKNTRGEPFLPSGDLPNPGVKPGSPALAGWFSTTEPPGKPQLGLSTSFKIAYGQQRYGAIGEARYENVT